jgi:hypothetical protein
MDTAAMGKASSTSVPGLNNRGGDFLVTDLNSLREQILHETHSVTEIQERIMGQMQVFNTDMQQGMTEQMKYFGNMQEQTMSHMRSTNMSSGLANMFTVKFGQGLNDSVDSQATNGEKEDFYSDSFPRPDSSAWWFRPCMERIMKIL